MKRRLPASILAVLMMALIIVAAQTALGAPATTVRGDIPVEKLWDHGSLPAAQQPQSVTVKLMQGSKVIQQITLTEGPTAVGRVSLRMYRCLPTARRSIIR